MSSLLEFETWLLRPLGHRDRLTIFVLLLQHFVESQKKIEIKIQSQDFKWSISKMKSMTQNKCLIEFDFKTVTKLSYELYKLKISLALQ